MEVMRNSWHEQDLAFTNLESAISMLKVCEGNAANDCDDDMARTLNVIRNLIAGALPIMNSIFAVNPDALILAPAMSLSAANQKA